MLMNLLRCIYGPELYRVLKNSGQRRSGRNYEMNNLEYYSNSFIYFVIPFFKVKLGPSLI